MFQSRPYYLLPSRIVIIGVKYDNFSPRYEKFQNGGKVIEFLLIFNLSHLLTIFIDPKVTVKKNIYLNETLKKDML